MKAILLCNIGTPLACDQNSVRTYLNEFLMDEGVINIPWIFRYPLVHWLISPRRSLSSSLKYQAIWTERGSPLLFFTEDLVKNLKAELSSDTEVLIGMNYSEPSIPQAFQKLSEKKVTEVLVVPLFPQYADATTGSIEGKIRKINQTFQIPIKFLPSFYSEDFFIDSTFQLMKDIVPKVDHVLFSYHGLPESHLKNKNNFCLSNPNCCLQKESCLKDCYKAQCLETTRRLAQKLGLSPQQYSVGFQSRLGPVKWIGPYTDDLLSALPKQGVRKLAVVCPSFVTDCIETLEELGIEGRANFFKHGGESFELISCLNASPIWSKNLAVKLRTMIEAHNAK